MVRAAILTPNLTMGGAERWIASLVRYADPRELEWTGVALSGWGGRDPQICAEITRHVPIYSEAPRSLDVRHADTHNRVQEVSSLKEAIRIVTQPADVLVTWGGFRFDHLVSDPEQPVVLVSHSTTAKQLPLTRAHGITHLAAVSYAAAVPLYHTGNPPVTVIYNGADTARLEPTEPPWVTRRQWGFDTQNYVIGYVGRFSPEKNPAAAALAALQLGDPWRAIYYGEYPPGMSQPSLQQQLTKLALASRVVQMRPATAYVGDVYRALDVLMLASRAEAFSLTMIEAWLCGVPVVATPVGAVPELEAKHGPLVIHVPLNPTTTELAAACRRAVSSEGQWIAARAKFLAEQHWTATAMAAQWANYLEAVIADSTPERSRQPLCNMVDLEV